MKYLKEPTTEHFVEALCEAAKEIIWRAEEIIGDIEGQQNITVTINLRPAEIVTIDVYKAFISGYKQHISYSKEDQHGRSKNHIESEDI